MDGEGFQEKVDTVYADIASLGADIVTPLPNYYQTNDPTLVSADRWTTIIPLVMTGSFEEVVENVPAVLQVVEEADGKDGFRVLMVGDASTAHDNNELAEMDLRRGERIGLPVALIILVVLFGTIAAALMPIGLSIICIIVTLGITALIGQAFELIFFVTLMIIMIGLAVGIDYSLVIISRYRDELARGLDKYAAIERAGATTGRTVLFSGLTVSSPYAASSSFPSPSSSPSPLARYWSFWLRWRPPSPSCQPTLRSLARESTACPSPSSARQELDLPSPPGEGSGSLSPASSLGPRSSASSSSAVPWSSPLSSTSRSRPA